MDSTFVKGTTLDHVVAQEWYSINAMLKNGIDYFQLAFILKSLIVAHPDYDSATPIIVSDLTACIEERLGSAAA